MLPETRDKSAAPSNIVDYLLISTPNLVVCSRVRMQLELGGVRTRETEMGLEVWCGARDWREIVEAIAVSLSPLERRDTRIACVAPSQDRSAVHRAIFRSRGIDTLLAEMREGWFEQVLNEGRIAIHFQPLLQYPPGRVHGYECLMRGIDAEGRLISPARMFEAAGTLDKVRALDEQCRIAAIRAAARVKSDSLTFFINFIPSAVGNPRKCVEAVMREAEAGGLRPNQIAFEVVETDKVDDPRYLLNILRLFRKAGFKIALDDVGAGYASLLSLSYLRPDYIKLDGELVRRAAHSALEAKMVGDLAETARQNGIITVAEGIETEQEMRLALASGIRLTQGYFHARPAPTTLGDEQTRETVGRIGHVAAGVGHHS